MAKYTTEVRSICETLAGNVEQQGFGEIESILETAVPLLFNFDFPIFDEDYRLVLEKKILRHYYTREIGEETVGLWKLRLDARLNDIMPYYNQLYTSELIEFNPMYDVDLNTTGNKEGSGTTAEETTGTSENTRVIDTDTTGSKDFKDDLNVNTYKASTTESKFGDDRKEVTDTDTTDTGTVNVATDNSGTSKNTGTRDADNWDKYSDTPQGGLSGISSDTYLTNAENNIVDEDTTSNTTTTDTGTQLTTNALKGTADTTVTHTGGTSTDTTVIDDIDELHSGGTSTDTTGTEDTTITDNGGTTGNKSGSSSSLEDYAEHVIGKRAGTTYSKMLLEFRQTFLNIDKMIIDELSDLFLNLW